MSDTPSALDLYNAVRAAILQILTNPIKSANFQGRSYTLQDLGTLQDAERLYYREALRNGEILGKGPVNVAHARFVDPWVNL